MNYSEKNFVVDQNIKNHKTDSNNFYRYFVICLKRKSRVGVTDPTFKPQEAMVEDKGEVTVSYLGEEKRNRVLTLKYKIDEPGL